MNTSEQALVSYLSGIKNRKIGFMALRTDVSGWCADIDLDSRYDLAGPECIFDDCNDAQAQMFLKAFLKNELSVSWSVSEQLCKLLATRGRLVSSTADPLLTTMNWATIGTHILFLSYLAVREDGAAWATRLLNEVREDGRDGLFLACYKLQSEELDRLLIAKFVEWEADGWTGHGTGELGWLQQFIAKWIKLYPYEDLEAVIRIYFKFIEKS